MLLENAISISVISENKDSAEVMYLGGGIDFGNAIGKMMTFEDVVEQSLNNDPDAQGIEIIGNAMDVVRAVKKIGEG